MSNYIFDQTGNAYEPLPSLADQKSVSLSEAYKTKKAALAPSPEMVASAEEIAAAEARLQMDTSDGLLAMMGSSVRQGAGNIARSYENIQQNVFGNEDYQLSPEVAILADEEASDIAAGFTGREEYTQDIQELTESVAKEDKGLADYFNIAKQGLALGPRALADSAASGLELAAGAGATALAGAVGTPLLGAAVGAAVLGSKAKKVVDKAEKVVSFIDRVKGGSKAVAKTAVKSAGRTSLLTADITEQMRQEYKESHNGEEPPAKYYAINVPITMALNAVEFGLITKAVPKFSKPTIRDMKEATKFMSKSHTKEAAKRILGGTGKVVKAASAEAGQEYLQTWHEILAPVVTADSMEQFVREAAVSLSDDKNQVEAIVGSILGFSAGGVARGVATVPTVTAGLAADVTKGTAKKVIKTVHSQTVKAGLKVLSEDERQNIRNSFESDEKLIGEKRVKMEEDVAAVKEAKTFDDLTSNKSIKAKAEKAQEDLGLMQDDLKDPDKVQAVKDRMERTYKAEQEFIEDELKLSFAAAVAKKSAGNIYEGAKKTAEKVIEAAELEKVVEAAEKYGKAAVKAVKNIRSSTALGLVELGIKGGKGSTRRIVDAAKKFELADLQQYIESIRDANPRLAKELEKVQVRKEKFLESTGQRSKDLVNKKTLAPAISDLAKSGTLKDADAASLSSIIQRTMNKRIADKETLAVIKEAVEAYKNSKAYINQVPGDGRITPSTMSSIDKKIKGATTRLGLKPTFENAEILKDKIVEGAEKVAKESGEKFKETKDYVKKNQKQRRKERVKEREERINEGKGDRSATERIIKGAKDVVTGTAEAAVKVKDVAVDKFGRKPKILEKNALYANLQQMKSFMAKGPDDVAIVTKQVPNIAIQMKEHGFETLQDLEDLAAQEGFEFLGQHEDFYAKLQAEFETDVIVKEDPGVANMKMKDIPGNKIISYFTELLPRC